MDSDSDMGIHLAISWYRSRDFESARILSALDLVEQQAPKDFVVQEVEYIL